VVCRSLPLDKRYYKWLLFAPAKDGKWKQFIQRLAQNGELELLNTARNLRPKEFSMLITNDVFEKMMAELSPKEREAYAKDVEEAGEYILDKFEKFSTVIEELTAKMTDEQKKAFLAKLKTIFGNLN
jgi:translation initiation factor 2B subunit (eIF-2B alpha/beta/delta family)